jgi:hypothetical protein
MAATQPRYLKPWAPPPPPRPHRVPSLPAVSGAAGGTNRDRRRSSTSHRHGGTADAVYDDPHDDGGLEDLRAKLMDHIHDAADSLRLPPVKPRRSPEPDPPSPPPPNPQDAGAVAAASSMPWTLRERRRRPSVRGSAPATPWSTALAATATQDDGVRAPFAVALEAEEIEEDVYALTGARPRRRPRKRPRTVQRQLDVSPINSNPHTAPRLPNHLIRANKLLLHLFYHCSRYADYYTLCIIIT